MFANLNCDLSLLIYSSLFALLYTVSASVVTSSPCEAQLCLLMSFPVLKHCWLSWEKQWFIYRGLLCRSLRSCEQAY